MSLFFDRHWFDNKLTVQNGTRAEMAAIAGVSVDELALMFKDQMEVKRQHVRVWALYFSVDEAEIARRCGVSTPVHKDQSDACKLADLEARVTRLEALLFDVIKQPDADL